MARNDQSQLPSGQDMLAAVRNHSGTLREKYRDDPIALGEKLGLRFPEKPALVMIRLGVVTEQEANERFGDVDGIVRPGIRQLVEDTATLEVRSAVAVANRGGGKSQGVSFIEFFLVFIKDFDALNLGGSELQAQGVYNYILSYIDAAPEFQRMLKEEPTISQTFTKIGAWIRVLTASQKSVRSPHAGGKKRDGRVAGGILVIDEEAEADADIVNASLSTINTARPSVNIRASTFHNAEGSFAEVIESHEEMGYKLYGWDIFDVAEKCDCTDGCQSEEVCFREDHYDTVIDPATGETEQKLMHRAYCGGRAMYADGWIPMEEIVTLWKRMKRSHTMWEVEAMGSRPSSKGFVIRDRKKFKENTTKKTGAELYMPGWPITIAVDWGTIAAGVEVWQEHPGDYHALLHAEQVEEAGVSQIIGIIVGLREQYLAEFQEVAADIGGGGNYLNPKLRDEHRIPCRDVNFAEMKESAVAALNVFNESAHILIPEEFDLFTDQLKKWKRDKGGRIVKGKDHLADASICYFAKFVERLGLSHIRIAPRVVRTSPRTPFEDRVQEGPVYTGPQRQIVGRVAAIRTIGSPRRR